MGVPVTVLGRRGLAGADFLRDEEEYKGPLAALSRFVPRAEFVFIAAGDMPLFDGKLVSTFADLIGEFDAVVPISGGRIQPLCGLYRSASLERIPSLVQSGTQRLMSWVDSLCLVRVQNDMLLEQGFDLRCVLGVNSIDELRAILMEHNI
jgi:molybdopterin-guanine dinucleotide biosynthesis protein A